MEGMTYEQFREGGYLEDDDGCRVTGQWSLGIGMCM